MTRFNAGDQVKVVKITDNQPAVMTETIGWTGVVTISPTPNEIEVFLVEFPNETKKSVHYGGWFYDETEVEKIETPE